MGNHCGPKENYVSILFSGEVHLSLDAHPSPFWLAGWVPEAKAPEAVAVALPEQLLLQPNRLDSADPDRQASGCGGFVMPALSQVWGHRGGGAVQAPHKHLSGVYTHITHTTPPVQTSLAALETSCFPASKPPRSRSEVSFPPTSLCRRPCPRYLQTLKAPLQRAGQAPALTLTGDGWEWGTLAPPGTNQS